jgi:hypothetical protein
LGLDVDQERGRVVLHPQNVAGGVSDLGCAVGGLEPHGTEIDVVERHGSRVRSFVVTRLDPLAVDEVAVSGDVSDLRVR